MRLNRLLAGLVALVVTAAMPLTAVATAEASTPTARHTSVVEKAKHRSVSISFAANGGTSFRLYGKVSPKGKNKTVVLLRASSAHGKYRVFRRDRANAQGKYAFTGLKSEGFYVAAVGASNGYRPAHSKVKHICKGSC